MSSEGGPSNVELIRRLFGLAWRYRMRCVQVLGHSAGSADHGPLWPELHRHRNRLYPAGHLARPGEGAPPGRDPVSAFQPPLGMASHACACRPRRPHPPAVGPAGGPQLRLRRPGQPPRSEAPGRRSAKRDLRQAPAAELPLLRRQHDRLDHHPGDRRRAVGAHVRRPGPDPERHHGDLAHGLRDLHGLPEPGPGPGLPRDVPGAPGPLDPLLAEDPARVRREPHACGKDGPVPCREHPGRRRRQGVRPGGREPGEIRGLEPRDPLPAVQHLLVGEPLLADRGIPDADQHDRAPRLWRHPRRPRLAPARRGPRRFRGPPRPVRRPGEQRRRDRQLGAAVADRRQEGL